MMDALSTQPHEPTDACADWHCYSHNVDELSGGYIRCLECGHVYLHRRSLWWANVRGVWKLRQYGSLPRMLLWTFWTMFERPDKIVFCQECLHDF